MNLIKKALEPFSLPSSRIFFTATINRMLGLFVSQTYNDLSYEKLVAVLNEVAKLDHTDADCILVAVLR